MSDIVLSASVRQNLLSLQSTADLLSTTQNRLATGNKVNTALDNPTNYFTALSLNNRASDINNLLDGVSNGVQVLQAANTGITSLQKLIDSAKSVANQALQATSGYATKSQITASINGASASNLLGTPDTDATVTGTVTGLSASTTLSPLFNAGDSFSINGKSITFAAGGNAGDPLSTTDSQGNITINLAYGPAGTTASTVAALQTALTADNVTSSFTGGALTLTSSDPSIPLTLADNTGGTLAKLGLTAGTTNGVNSKINGLSLVIPSTAGGTQTNITFGTGTNQIHTLDQLNTALSSNNLEAQIDSTGKLVITTTNDDASYVIGTNSTSGTPGTISGSAVTGLNPPAAAITNPAFANSVVSAPVQDADAQSLRANLVTQYNNIIQQIQTTAQDSSFNGVNLLNGDQLKLVFNETGTSTLNIQGVSDNPAGLGLNSLTAGADFIDNAHTNGVLDNLDAASNTLRSQASTLGSNLSIVQIRQDFSKNLINVLQTGASNLTLADTNEEAANSQALSTRQSIAVSALALANQSQQSVLRLLQ